METIDPLLALKPQLLDFSPEELMSYVERLTIGRMKGPKVVKRSKETGRPSAGRTASPLSKLDKLLASMSAEEKAAFIQESKQQMELLAKEIKKDG